MGIPRRTMTVSAIYRITEQINCEMGRLHLCRDDEGTAYGTSSFFLSIILLHIFTSHFNSAGEILIHHHDVVSAAFQF